MRMCLCCVFLYDILYDDQRVSVLSMLLRGQLADDADPATPQVACCTISVVPHDGLVGIGAGWVPSVGLLLMTIDAFVCYGERRATSVHAGCSRGLLHAVELSLGCLVRLSPCRVIYSL